MGIVLLENIEAHDRRRQAEHIGVFIVEHDAYFRRGLRTMLGAHGAGVLVVGEHSWGPGAPGLIVAGGPDVVLLDVALPGEAALDAVRLLAAEDTRVLLLGGGSGDDEIVLEALLAGADGQVARTASAAEMIAAIEAVAHGGSVVSPAIAARLLGRLRSAREAIASVRETDRPLTPREHDVLRLLAAGRENSQIAEELVISPRTVRTHVANILEKLEVDSRVHAAVYAVRNGLA